MIDYTIYTDTGCDITPETLKEWNVKFLKLVFRFEDEDREYYDMDIEIHQFYDMLRSGKVAKTAGLNYDTYKEAFESELKEGHDVLYVGFSSGLSSTTAKLATMVCNDLAEDYPDRKLIVIDTLGASAGHGLTLYHAVKNRQNGLSIEDNASAINELIPHMCHWFTVDDLMFLKRGGRVSGAAAIAGTVLNIKPVLHMDNEGHLIPMFKTKGRKKALKALAMKFIDTALKDEYPEYYISHGDCYEDALKVEEYIYEATGIKASIITYIGSVIGAHSGPGTVSLFFVGNER